MLHGHSLQQGYGLLVRQQLDLAATLSAPSSRCTMTRKDQDPFAFYGDPGASVSFHWDTAAPPGCMANTLLDFARLVKGSGARLVLYI